MTRLATFFALALTATFAAPLFAQPRYCFGTPRLCQYLADEGFDYNPGS